MATNQDKGIQAIPTVYRGVQMRSRLEATWAAFFDHLGMEWEYEPAVFTGRGWLPDFLLPWANTVCEIKPVVGLSEWESHPCLEKIARRVKRHGLPRTIFLLGIAPIFLEDAAIFGFSFVPHLDDFIHPVILRVKDDQMDFVIAARDGVFSRLGGDLMNDEALLGLASARAAWADAKNCLQWRSPNGS